MKEEKKDRLGLDYWGKVIESVRNVVQRKDESEMSEVYQMLKMGLAIIENSGNNVSASGVSTYNGNHNIYEGNHIINTGTMS